MAEVYIKMYKAKKANEEDGSHGSKIEQGVVQRDSSPKWGKSLMKQNTRKRRRTSSPS